AAPRAAGGRAVRGGRGGGRPPARPGAQGRPLPVPRLLHRGARHRTLRARLLVAVAALLALAGCVSIPDSGPVRAADPLPPEGSSVTLIAYGPTPGATAHQIVQGFLRAVAAGGGDEFAVAREYLAAPVA